MGRPFPLGRLQIQSAGMWGENLVNRMSELRPLIHHLGSSAWTAQRLSVPIRDSDC